MLVGCEAGDLACPPSESSIVQCFWYLFAMKKNPRTRRFFAQPPRINLEQLTRTIAMNEQAQRRFRTIVLNAISKIETTVTMIHGAQIVEAHGCADSEAMRKHTQSAEEYISSASKKLGLAMIDFIYGESRETDHRPGRGRQWSDWEI